MFVQPQHQDNSRALGPQSGRSRPIGAPAYYLGGPPAYGSASPAPRGTRNDPKRLADAITAAGTIAIMIGAFRAAHAGAVSPLPGHRTGDLDGWHDRGMRMRRNSC
jgi:hypothetical protein